MQKKFINPWYDSRNRTMLRIYTVDGRPFAQIGDYSVYRHCGGYLYTYKDTAISYLAGFNKRHLAAIATNTRPVDPQQEFLFDRAVAVINKYNKENDHECAVD